MRAVSSYSEHLTRLLSERVAGRAIYRWIRAFCMDQKQKRGLKIILTAIAILVVFIIFIVAISGNSSQPRTTKSTVVPTKSVEVKPTASPTPDITFAVMSFGNSGVTIKNTENVPLKSCQLTSGYYQNYPGVQMNHDDWYEYDMKDEIPPLGSALVYWSSMTRIDNGTRFNYYQQAPENLMVECQVNGQDSFSTKITNQ